MEIREKYVLQDAIRKGVEDEFDYTKADMKAELLKNQESTGTPRAGVQIGRFDIEIKLCKGRETLDGNGDGFLDFLEEKGFVKRSADSEWRKHAEALPDGRIIWRDTGEVIPGAFVKQSASYPSVTSGYKRSEIPELLREAQRMGLIGGDMPLLLGGAE